MLTTKSVKVSSPSFFSTTQSVLNDRVRSAGNLISDSDSFCLPLSLPWSLTQTFFVVRREAELSAGRFLSAPFLVAAGICKVSSWTRVASAAADQEGNLRISESQLADGLPSAISPACISDATFVKSKMPIRIIDEITTRHPFSGNSK